MDNYIKLIILDSNFCHDIFFYKNWLDKNYYKDYQYKFCEDDN